MPRSVKPSAQTRPQDRLLHAYALLIRMHKDLRTRRAAVAFQVICRAVQVELQHIGDAGSGRLPPCVTTL